MPSGALEGSKGRPEAADCREYRPDRPRKRGPKRGPNPLSKTIPTGHTASHGARGTRRDETPGAARDSGLWRAKEMVDRGRIELPTPGFSVPCSRLSSQVGYDGPDGANALWLAASRQFGSGCAWVACGAKLCHDVVEHSQPKGRAPGCSRLADRTPSRGRPRLRERAPRIWRPTASRRSGTWGCSCAVMAAGPGDRWPCCRGNW
jgi:hypothetical protein